VPYVFWGAVNHVWASADVVVCRDAVLLYMRCAI